jgi:hypothetical protein
MYHYSYLYQSPQTPHMHMSFDTLWNLDPGPPSDALCFGALPTPELIVTDKQAFYANHGKPLD